MTVEPILCLLRESRSFMPRRASKMILPVVLPAGLHVNSVPRVMMVTVQLNAKCMTPSAITVALQHRFPSSPVVPNPYTVENASKTLKTDTNCTIFDFRPIRAEVFIIF